ncbi:uncharacterized protein O3C94_018981 [Discoglossus pictus]
MMLQAISSNACVNGTVSGKLWFVTYFGAFTTFLKWTDIILVYSTIQVDDATGFLKADDLYGIALSGSLAITVVSFYDFLAKLRGHAGILYTYIDQLRNYVTQVPTAVSVKFKKVVLLETTKLFFSKIPKATLNTVQQWFPKLDFLLKEINSTMLDAWKPDSPCSYFKLFNRQLNIIFKSLDQQQQTDVYTYVKNYLSYQVANTTSPCKEGTTSFTDWLQNVVGTNICSLANPDDIQKINTDFDLTTFKQVCTPAK